VNNATVEHGSTVKRKSQREAAKCCFSKPMVQQLKLMGPTNKNYFFLYYQTLKYVAAGEPHPQPPYQIASKTDFSIETVVRLEGKKSC